jgi:hypothetical protein
MTAPVEGHASISDLFDAHELCVAAGVVQVFEGSVRLSDELKSMQVGWERRLAILDRLWSADPPAWLNSTAQSQLLVMMPEDDRAVLELTEADVATREAFLLGMARKVDAQRLAALGALAEAYVVAQYGELLESIGGGTCNQLSIISDQLGYDLSVTTSQGTIRVEVKAAAGVNVLRVFLTRHEVEVAQRIPTWRLVICRSILHSTEFRIAGHLMPGDLIGRLPVDSDSGSWETCRLVLPTDLLRSELPLP